MKRREYKIPKMMEGMHPLLNSNFCIVQSRNLATFSLDFLEIWRVASDRYLSETVAYLHSYVKKCKENLSFDEKS